MSDAEQMTPAEQVMRKDEMARCFNEWMRRFINDSKAFEKDFESVNRHLSEVANGEPPSYGEVCSDYLFRLAADGVEK